MLSSKKPQDSMPFGIVLQACHWSGQCLTHQEASNIVFQGLDTSLSAHDLSHRVSPDDGLSDSAKVAIMIIMACVLFIVALVCAWVLFGRKRHNITEEESSSAARAIHETLELSTPPRSVPSSPQGKHGPYSDQMVHTTDPCQSPFLKSSWNSDRSFGNNVMHECNADVDVAT